MSHINADKLIKRIEHIIHDPAELSSFKHHARNTLTETGKFPDTPAWNYIQFRHDLSPINFNKYHPEFKHLFHLRDIYQHGQPTTYVSVSPPIKPPRVCAEPSSIMSFGVSVVIVMVVLWQRLRG